VTNVVPGLIIGFLHAHRIGSEKTRRIVSWTLLNIPLWPAAGPIGAVLRSRVQYAGVECLYALAFGLIMTLVLTLLLWFIYKLWRLRDRR